MRVNYDPDERKRNLYNLYKEVNNVQVNTVWVEESPQSQQRYGIADIEELPDSGSHGSLDPETNVNPIIANYDVTLIDPLQLIDWKDQTPPEHLYPKFKIFLDNFKSNHQAPYQQ